MELTESDIFHSKRDTVSHEFYPGIQFTFTFYTSEDTTYSSELEIIESSDSVSEYIIFEHTLELRAMVSDFRRGIAEIIRYIKQEYFEKTYTYTVYYSDDSDPVKVELTDEDIVLFTLGRTEDEYDSTTTRQFSYKFWAGLQYVEKETANNLERVDPSMPIEGVRYNVRTDQNEIETELLTHIGKYLFKFYKNNNVLRDDPDLHRLLSYAAFKCNTDFEGSTNTICKL